MGYRILYGKEMLKEHIDSPVPRLKRKNLLIWFMIACLLLIFVISGSEAGWRGLLPGNPDVTERAVCTFVSDLSEGESFKDAITAFCMEIIENG